MMRGGACIGIVLLLFCATWPAAAQAPSQIEIDGRRAHLTFDDEFDRLDLDMAARGQGWVPWFKTFNVRSLKGNQELQLYADKDYLDRNGLPASLDPFRIENGVLTITANRLAPAFASHLPAKEKGLLFTSGMISSELSFSQTYGYFEARIKLPPVRGTWPAFWLMPASGHWPPEIDILEAIGQERTRVHQNAIRADKVSAHTHVDVPTDLAEWHRYGLLWTRQELVWFVDGAPTKRIANVVDEPMYMIVNLAVGGKWPGTPPADTPFPASMSIDYVRAYALD